MSSLVGYIIEKIHKTALVDLTFFLKFAMIVTLITVLALKYSVAPDITAGSRIFMALLALSLTLLILKDWFKWKK